MSVSDLIVTETAIRQGRACGLWGNTEARIRGLAAHAMRSNHPAGNMAYGPFILLIHARRVLSITLVGPRVEDDRPVSACKLCGGLMVRRVRTVIGGEEGFASRACPRAFDPTQPLCDTIESSTED